MKASGLSFWLGNQLEPLSFLPAILFIAVVVLLVIFLTELTSNVATMTTLAPILGTLATAIGAAPESLLAPAAVAASCAFMLPVATAPNAIIYGSGHVTISQMMRAGVRVNVIGAALITVVGFWIAPLALGVTTQASGVRPAGQGVTITMPTAKITKDSHLYLIDASAYIFERFTPYRL